jgi:hypothetical protein
MLRGEQFLLSGMTCVIAHVSDIMYKKLEIVRKWMYYPGRIEGCMLSIGPATAHFISINLIDQRKERNDHGYPES